MFKDEKEKKRKMRNTQIRNEKKIRMQRMVKRQKQKRAQRD